MADPATTATTADDLDPRRQHSHEELNHHDSSPQSQKEEQEPRDRLRTAPTVKLDNGNDTTEDAAPAKPTSPGILQKTMQKLGLSRQLLVVMLKCVFQLLLLVLS